MSTCRFRKEDVFIIVDVHTGKSGRYGSADPRLLQQVDCPGGGGKTAWAADGVVGPGGSPGQAEKVLAYQRLAAAEGDAGDLQLGQLGNDFQSFPGR